jgi:phosphohistidine phosphatase
MPIYLVQHGVAVPEEIDSNRPLSAEGRKQVERIASHLRKAGVSVRKVCHSGKTRARETAQLYAAYLGDGTLSEVSGMNPSDPVVRFAASLGEDDTMYVGHLPHLGKLVSYLVAGDENAGVVKFVNGGVVCVEKGSVNYHVAWYMIPSLCDL